MPALSHAPQTMQGYCIAGMLPIFNRCDDGSGFVQLSLDQELCRKGRTHPDSLKNSGRAGDLTKRSGTCARVEEEWAYAHKEVDGPSTQRFAAAMAANAREIKLSPTEAQQHAASTLRDEQAAVAALSLVPDGEPAADES